jgi:hypothetical protein
MNNVTQVIVEYVCGNTPGKKAAENAAQSQRTDKNGRILGGEFDGAKSTFGKGGLSKDGVHELTKNKHGWGMPDGKNRAGMEYEKWTKSHSGQREPVIEALLQNVKEDPEDVMVRVATGSGNRIMNLTEAIRDFHDEVVAGKIEFVNGSHKGKSFEEVAGIAGDTTRKWDNDAKKKTSVGKSEKDYYKKHPEDDPSKTGTGGTPAGSIGLTPEASRWFKIMDPTDTSGLTPPETVSR